jgi:hypothetical protein
MENGRFCQILRCLNKCTPKATDGWGCGLYVEWRLGLELTAKSCLPAWF